MQVHVTKYSSFAIFAIVNYPQGELALLQRGSEATEQRILGTDRKILSPVPHTLLTPCPIIPCLMTDVRKSCTYRYIFAFVDLGLLPLNFPEKTLFYLNNFL